MFNGTIFNQIIKLSNLKENFYSSPKLINKPKGKRILVLAPHFDDEILGCGGTLRKHVLAKNKIKIVYVTDGSKGIYNIKDAKKVFEIRKKESLGAISTLGININDVDYLYEIDGEKQLNKKSIIKLSLIINKYRPDLIYLPWFLDSHNDHKKTNIILYASLKRLNYACNICAYEIWTPLIPNILVDIGDFFDLKLKAINSFKSQLAQIRYDLLFQGLNMYRSSHNPKDSSYAEAFFLTYSDKYFKLMKQIKL